MDWNALKISKTTLKNVFVKNDKTKSKNVSFKDKNCAIINNTRIKVVWH